MSDRTIPRPDPWGNDFVWMFGEIAAATEDWAAAIETAHHNAVTDWGAFTPGVAVHATEQDWNGTPSGQTPAGITLADAELSVAWGSVLVNYRIAIDGPAYGLTVLLPAECRFPPCIAYAYGPAGQVTVLGGHDRLTLGPPDGGLAAGTFHIGVRFTDTGAPESGDWILGHPDYQLDLNTVLT